MEEKLIKTHLIVTDTHNEYRIKWTGRIIDTKPKFKNNKPIFIIVGGNGRMELNTTDMERIEKCAKLCTKPKGRGSVTSDIARIYIIEENDNEVLLGTFTNYNIKTYAPMYDCVGYEKDI